MRNVRIVARHEFRTALSRLSYIILTAAPAVLIALAVVGLVIYTAVNIGEADDDAGGGTQQADRVGYVDNTGASGGALFLGHQRQVGALFVPMPDRAAGIAALAAEEIDALFIFPEEFAATGAVVRVRVAEQQIAGLFGAESGGSYTGALRGFVLANLFARDVSPELTERLSVPYVLRTEEVQPDGSPAEDAREPVIGRAAFFIVVGVSLMVSIFFSAGYMLNALAEEKENRVMEVLISSVKPSALLLGKVLGLGAAGLLQMIGWMAPIAIGLLLVNLIVDIPASLIAAPSLSDILVAAAYFLFGYLLFASLMAAVGAVTTSLREANQVSALVILPAFIPVWLNFLLLSSPEGPLARVLTLVPFTAPVTGLMRHAVDAIGVGETVAALLILAASAAAAIFLAMRLFRIYLLTYGKRPTAREIARGVLRG